MTIRAREGGAGAVRYVVGVGLRRGVTVGDLVALVDDLARGMPIGEVVTSGRKRDDPAVSAIVEHLGAELVVLDDDVLRAQAVRHPSATVARHVGVPSVAEAAVLARGGAVVARTRSAVAVVVLGRLSDAS